MPDSNIAARMSDFFERQIAWFRQMLQDIAHLEKQIDQDDNESIVEEDARRARKSREMETEFLALKKEWDQAGPRTGPDADAVRELAAQAEGLARSVQAAVEGASAKAQGRATALRGELDQLRQNTASVAQYRQTTTGDPDFVDRKA